MESTSVITTSETVQMSTKILTTEETAPVIGCSTTADSICSQQSGPCRFTCPAGCTADSCDVWGTTMYTADSCVCKAAIHDGRITDVGGAITLNMAAGLSSYQSSTAHGITTISFGSWPLTVYFSD
ncbi:vitrin-like [Saccoglossus kowalevskii]